MADSVEVTTIKMRGIEYPVYVDNYGRFHTTIEGHDLASDTLREVQTQAERVPRRKVAVRFAVVDEPGNAGRNRTEIRPGGVRFATATGFHATSTDSLLVDFDGQRKGVMSGSRIHNAVQVDYGSELDEIRALLDADAAARKAVLDWISAHAVDVHQLVRDELNKAGDDGE
jgi:hypothetical protein